MRFMNIADYKHDLFTYAKLLLGTDSPTGYTSRVVESIGQVAESLEYGFEKTIKGKSAGKTAVAQTLIPVNVTSAYFFGLKIIEKIIIKSKTA